MYLFRPKRQASGQSAGEGASAPVAASPFQEALPALPSSTIQPGSAAQWALGELLIRLFNRGRALRPEPPETPNLE